MKKKMIPYILSAALLLAAGCGEEGKYSIVDPNEETAVGGNFSTVQGEIAENQFISGSGETDAEYTEIAPGSSRDEDMFVDETEYSEEEISETDDPDIYTMIADVKRDVNNTVKEMSAEHKAAQLILARCPSEGAVEMMSKYKFGGYTLYARDFENRDMTSAEEFISEIINASEITPFIAVDEEGGDIVRVSKFPAYRDAPFDSILNIYSESGMDGISENTKEKARLLTSLGINLNLAPVADIAENGDYIYDRTAGTGAEETGDIVRKITDISGEYGLMSCIKHFPGYGGNVDTHTGIARDSRSLESFRENDFIPFKNAIGSSYSPAVLVNHNIVECMNDTVPASLSIEVHKILREELGFEGVIITDDLGMDGINAYTGDISPYVMGIMAGNDLLCVSDPVTAYNDILSAIDDGTLPMSVIDEHVKRIIQMKDNFGI